MEIYTSLRISIDGTNDEVRDIVEVLSECLQIEIEAEKTIEIEDTMMLPRMKEVNDLGCKMARAARNANFFMTGSIDVINDGSELYFEIELDDKKLRSSSPAYYHTINLYELDEWIENEDFERACELKAIKEKALEQDAYDLYWYDCDWLDLDHVLFEEPDMDTVYLEY